MPAILDETLERVGHLRVARPRYDYPPRCGEGGGVVVSSGLSVVCQGHLIYVERDVATMVASVLVRRLPHGDPRCANAHKSDAAAPFEGGGPSPQVSVADAAELLAQRAQRFLGLTWKVERWEPPTK